jgi:ubiquinone/menaquinone biosynthesis C-methylase UbiE
MLLDVGCSTGSHIQYLKTAFNCVGIDSSKEMLEVAEKKVAGVKFMRGNMMSFDLGRQFDVILCLFSGIGYVKTYPNLRKTFGSFWRHLKPGGVAIVEPWFTKANWRNGSIHLRTYNSETLKIARVGFSGSRGNISVMDERYLIAEKGKGIGYFEDLVEMGLFDIKKTLRIMRDVGFRAKYIRQALSPGRGLYVGVRQL